MATYAIGDIQGCYDTFQHLLAAIDFDSARDRLWLVGDLVNRGPRSLDVLRWAYAHDDVVTAVLGNHDLHLLAAAVGLRRAKRLDTIQEVLEAPDRDELLRWLRHRPFLHVDGDNALVHAGLLPAWSIDEARKHARALEKSLRKGDGAKVLKALQTAVPSRWEDATAKSEQLAFRAAVMTRMRAVDATGAALYNCFAGTLEAMPDGQVPWFRVPGRRSSDHRLIVGHWSALGLHVDDGICALDTGCVWGGELTAMCLEDGRICAVPYGEEQPPLGLES